MPRDTEQRDQRLLLLRAVLFLHSYWRIEPCPKPIPVTNYWTGATSGLTGNGNKMVAVPKDTSLKGFVIFQIKFTQETWLSISFETPATLFKRRKTILYAYWPILHSFTQTWILSPLHFGEEPSQQGFHALPPRVAEPPKARKRKSWAHSRAAQRVSGVRLRRGVIIADHS